MDFSWIGPLGLVALLPLALIIAIVLFIVSTVRAVQRNKAQPVQTIPVQIVTKNEEGFLADNRQRLVDFQTENGGVLQIAVTNDMDYAQMTKGMHGMLTFRGWNYKSFVPVARPQDSAEESQAVQDWMRTENGRLPDLPPGAAD